MPMPMGLGQQGAPPPGAQAGQPPSGSSGDPSMGGPQAIAKQALGGPSPDKTASMGPGPKPPGPGGAPPQGAPPGDPFDMATGAFSKATKAHKQASQTSKVWGKLTKLGDMVQPEDVIEAGGDLVGIGAVPSAVAQLMADMPTTGGASLAGWVDQHGQQVTQMLQQATQAKDQMGHLVATTGMQRLLQLGHAQQTRLEMDKGHKAKMGASSARGVKAEPAGASANPLGAQPPAGAAPPPSDSPPPPAPAEQSNA